MTQLDCCRQVLADISATVAATLPLARASALLALLRPWIRWRLFSPINPRLSAHRRVVASGSAR